MLFILLPKLFQLWPEGALSGISYPYDILYPFFFFLTLSYFLIFQTHIFHVFSPRISHFSEELFFFFFKRMLFRNHWALDMFGATGLSLLLGLLSRQSWVTCVCILTSVNRRIIVSVFLHLYIYYDKHELILMSLTLIQYHRVHFRMPSFLAHL